jgi:hypothetical protein
VADFRNASISSRFSVHRLTPDAGACATARTVDTAMNNKAEANAA